MTVDQQWKAAFIRALWIVAGVLVTVSAVTYLIMRLTSGNTWGWVFDEIHQNLSIGVDIALPTWFAVCLWAFLGLLAWMRGQGDRQQRFSWRLLAAVAWVASVDEFLMLHERLSKPASLIEGALGIDLGGVTWLLVGGVVALAVAASLARLVLSLPASVRRDVLVGAAIFLSGAVGFELVSHMAAEASGEFGLAPVVLTHIEEALEFAGVILAIRGLLGLPMLLEQPGADTLVTVDLPHDLVVTSVPGVA